MYMQWMLLLSSLAQIFGGWIPERIVGGHSVPISSVPWQASLQQLGTHICGASIYSDRIVITAAHCVLNTSPSILAVRVGSSIRNYGGQLVGVSRILVHEDYHKANKYSHDVALVRLQNPLLFNSRVRPIPLASSSPAPGSEVSVSGWGAVDYLGPTSTSLLGVTLSIVSHDSCSIAYSGLITNVMICAAAQGKDTCSEDSGGPLVSDDRLVGIVSFGEECAHPNYPGVYADVAELRPWILQAINRI